MPLAVNDALVVDEIVEDRHCDGVLLPVLDTQGEPEGEDDTVDERHRDEDGLPVREPVTLSLGEWEAHSVDETVEDRHMEEVLLAVREPLGELEREVSKENVWRSEEDVVLSLDLEWLPLDDTDTLLVDEMVVVGDRDEMLLPEREEVGETEGEKDTEDVLHSEAVGLPLLELEKLPLIENVTLTVEETVEEGLSEDATLTLLKPLGDGDRVPEAEKLFPPEELPHCVEVTVEERQRDGEPLAVRDTLGETEGDRETEDEWHKDDSRLPLGRPVRLLLVVNVAVGLPEPQEVSVRVAVCEPVAQEVKDGVRVPLEEKLPLGVEHELSVGDADIAVENEVHPELDAVGDFDAHTVGV